MDANNLREACFRLAESLMWQIDVLRSDEVEDNINELSEITDKLYDIAMANYAQVEFLPDGETILIRAIKYIERVHAIPPLRGRYAWFDYTLHTLLELCNPISVLNKENLAFLDDLQNGIENYKKNTKQE